MPDLIRTARVTGLFYLGLAISGGLGFLLIRPRLFDADDAETTLANVTGNEALARGGVAFELLIVGFQVLVAIWFYRLFRDSRPVAAASIAAFGFVNAIAVLVSAAMLATAVDVAADGPATTVQLLYQVSENLWAVGNLFFGLWLIPMGACVLTSRRMPRLLGWVLEIGGVGYVLAAFAGVLTDSAPALIDAAVIPATVGEFWMIIYLLVWGIRRSSSPSPAPAIAPVTS